MLDRGPSRLSLQMLADLWQRPHQSQIKAVRSLAAQVNQRTTPKNQSGTGLRDFNNYAGFDQQILSHSLLNQEADHFKTIQYFQFNVDFIAACLILVLMDVLVLKVNVVYISSVLRG